MIRTYTCEGEYKGHSFKIISANIARKPDCEYGAVVEINGVKRHTRIGTKQNVFDNVKDAIDAAKRLIDLSFSPA